MKLGMRVGLGPGHIVLDGDQAPLPQRGTAPNFRPISVAANGCMDQDVTWYGARPRPRRLRVRCGPRSPLPKGGGAEPPKFSAHVYCGQTAGWMKLVLGMDVGLSPGDFVLDGDPVPFPKKWGGAPKFSAHVYCGQTAGWIKMPLGTEVGLGLRDIVFDVDPATPEKRHTHPYPIFSPCLLWPDGWTDEDAAWYGSRSRPRPHCTRRGPSSRERGTAAPLFSAHVCCVHGRPSQLLLSSCTLCSQVCIIVVNCNIKYTVKYTFTISFLY